MEKQEKLVLIDGNSIINRAFYALPLLSNSDGEFSNAVYGFCNILVKLIEKECPKYIAVAFDTNKPTFRHKIYADYKAGRKKMPDELAVQLPILKNLLKSMNISIFELEGIEADDIIGSLAKKFSTDTIILSGDRDLFQLVDDTTKVWFTKRGISDTIVVTPENIKDVYGVNASEVVLLKALMGDSSDHITGVAGVGEKTAKSLVEQFGTLDNIYQNLEQIKSSVAQKLKAGKDDAYLSQTLATINTNVELNATLENLTYDFPFKKSVYDIFQKYEMRTLTNRKEIFDEDEIIIKKKVVNIKNITTQDEFDSLVKNLESTQKLAIHLSDNELHIANSKFEENIVILKDNLLDNGIYSQYVFEKLKPVLEQDNVSKLCLNSKNLMTALKHFDVTLKGISFDGNLALYLLLGSKKTDCTAKDFAEQFSYDEKCVATSLYASSNELLERLKSQGMLDLFYNVELPLVYVLFEMEQNGFKIDVKNLHQMGVEYNSKLEKLTGEIYALAGTEFNIKSPKQLGEVLFEKLNLQTPRYMKKSTAGELLEKISNQHPIIEKILEFRKIEKLVSTYIEPFEKLADRNGYIHTVFNQTLTSTGRLSSSEPNLQNIPIRDEEGKNLRKLFIPSEPNGKIISSDYSQIELRLLAHFSEDPKLLNAYKNGVDIHAQTASDIFAVPLEDVTEKMRRDAKSVNFGIIYGISDYGLSNNINSTREDAKLFINRYLD